VSKAIGRTEANAGGNAFNCWKSLRGARMRLLAPLLCAALASATVAGTAVADTDYPNRPITLVVPFSAGGAVDVVARVLGEYASRALGQPAVVENVTGAGGTIAAARVARAAADGYTILVGNLGTQVSSVGNYKDLPYDPRRDFAPVILAANTPEVLIINKNLPCKNLQDFVAYSKASGHVVTMGSAGIGSISHLAYLLFNSVAKTKIIHVPYRGDPDADADLLGGRIDAAFNQAVLASSYIRSDKVKALVVTAPRRLAILPDVPSSAEAGIPDLQVNAWTAFFAPKTTPEAVVRKLNATVARAFTDDAILARLSALGVDVPSPEERTPGALKNLVSAEFDRWLPLIQAAEQPSK
jgi:putative tricarboxylic transport membrane protein